MRKSRFSEEKIIRILSQVEGGETVKDVCREHGASENTYYRWKKKYGGMTVSEARRLKELEAENRRLKTAVAELTLDSYEPLGLWLIPIYLRSRVDYYTEAIEGIQQKVEAQWQRHLELAARAGIPEPVARKQFEGSSYVKWVWRHDLPDWWGLNDIVGFIDVRLDVWKQVIFAALFLPAKRISRRLKDKTYLFQRKLSISLERDVANDLLREEIDQMVGELLSDKKLRKRYVDLDQWRTKLRHTDLVGIIQEVSAAEAIRNAEEIWEETKRRDAAANAKKD